MSDKQVKDAWSEMRRFYTARAFPRDGEHLLIDGREYVAHLKGKNEDCEKCSFFITGHGCGVTLEKLDCFDMMAGKRYYFTEVEEDGEEVITEESKESF